MTTLWEYAEGAPEDDEPKKLRINTASAARMTQYLAARNRWMELRLCGAGNEAVRAAEVVMRAFEDAALRAEDPCYNDE
ncbi:MAG: hypothetical protein ACP5VE_08940 [Chthonomonadales bacterium]